MNNRATTHTTDTRIKNMPIVAVVGVLAVALLLAIVLVTPFPASAAGHGGPLSFFGDLWNNAVNLVTNPRDQIGRAASIAGEGIMGLVGDVLAKALEGVSWALMQLAAYFLQAMAAILEIAIMMTINIPLNKLKVVEVGWTAVRDLANMFFIFALLYIAIQTILGLAGGNAKRWLAHIIIAAVLINFSLFATTVVVDAGNILALSFYEKTKTTQGSKTITIKDRILEGLKLQTLVDSAKNKQAEPVTVTPIAQAMINIGGTVFMLIAGYVCLAGALMMITRTIMLAILMIFSPFAFMAFGLPKLEQYGHKWLDKLIKQTFTAPIFIFMLYLNVTIITSLDLISDAKNLTWSSVFTGETTSYLLIYNFIILIGFFISSLIVANGFAGGVGSHAQGWAKKASGWMAAGTVAGGGFALRQTAGRFGQNRMDNEEWQKKQRQLVAKGSMKDATIGDKFRARTANLKLAGAQKAATGTFDLRNAPMGGLGVSAALGAAGISTGTGTKKSYQTHGEPLSSLTGRYAGTEKEKELIATAKERFAGNPDAQRAYLKERGVELDAKRNKEVLDSLDREKRTEENKKAFEDQLKVATGGLGLKELAQMDPSKIKEVNDAVKAQIAAMTPDAAEAFVKSFGSALEKVGGKEYTEMGQNFLKLDVVQQNSTGRQVAEIQSKLADGTMRMDKPEEYSAQLSQNVIRGGTESARRYVANQVRQGNSSLVVNGPAELDWAMHQGADEETHEKNVKNALNFMTYDDVARMPVSELQNVDPFLTDAHYKAMGKKKAAELKSAVETREKGAQEAQAARARSEAAARETPLPTIDPNMIPDPATPPPTTPTPAASTPPPTTPTPAPPSTPPAAPSSPTT